MAATNPVAVFPKDPSEVLDYTEDWGEWLKTDTILNISWTVPAGLTNAGNYGSQSTATIWLSGGTAGTTYLVVCEITTVGGRTSQRTVQINVGDR